mmetsp:Transcript_15014/g.34659  ORF Transcript_15014/g.34659 Transcript_15014/m.34659 type:complete len:101 (+) Transcript_15014:2621-2923(+)
MLLVPCTVSSIGHEKDEDNATPNGQSVPEVSTDSVFLMGRFDGIVVTRWSEGLILWSRLDARNIQAQGRVIKPSTKKIVNRNPNIRCGPGRGRRWRRAMI